MTNSAYQWSYDNQTPRTVATYERSHGRFRCTENVRPYRDITCSRRFLTKRQLDAHMKADHPYFYYDPQLKKENCTCKVCGHCPGRKVEKPRDALRSHERKMHKIYVRPYVIREEP